MLRSTLNRSQRKLVGGLLPFAAVLILLVLPTNRWDSRPLYLAIFVAVLLVCYIEILLFDLEDRLRRLGKRFAIVFPAVVFVVAFLIAASPNIRTRPAYWYPDPPQAQRDPWEGLVDSLQPRKNAQEYEQYLRRKGEIEAKKENEYKQALLEWEKTRRLIPPEHSLELKYPIDRRVAPYWLALLLLVGAIEFRLLSQSSFRSSVLNEDAAKKPPTG